MKSLIIWSLVLLFEALTTWLFWRRLTVHGQGDGDLGLGMLFWLMIAAYVVSDLIGAIVQLVISWAER